jgi:hypothetical protein
MMLFRRVSSFFVRFFCGLRYIFLLDHPEPLLDHLGGPKTALARPLDVNTPFVCEAGARS